MVYNLINSPTNTQIIYYLYAGDLGNYIALTLLGIVSILVMYYVRNIFKLLPSLIQTY